MKISTNSIRALDAQFKTTDQDTTAVGASGLHDLISSKLGAVEEMHNFGVKFAGVIIAHVVSCEKHPNADRLNVCLIDDGGVAQDVERNNDGLVQVVCGAPNVRAGITVAWLPPGATVPDSYDTDPFVLSARELRGVVSNGMLASAKELAISDNHDGILEITEDIAPGTAFADALQLHDDTIIDLENKMFTHRPDCFGFLGVARELAGIQGIAYTSPDWYVPNLSFPDAVSTLPLTVRNEIPELVPRFTAITLSNVTIGPSPLWLQVELAKVGSRSINNIVDLTNYYMLLTGQPLHAYDYDKVTALSEGEPTIIVRQPQPDETVALLNGKTVTPRAEAILIATGKQAIGIAGVMGGADTEVDSTTRNIILESANFNMYSIRRTSMANGLFTDAVTRFNKGQSPLQNLTVLAKIVSDIETLAGGTVAGPVIDDNHLDVAMMERQSVHVPVTVSADFINSRLGSDLSVDAMKILLENVEFIVEVVEQELTITAPFWRTDIEIAEDIIEEVGRLYGFDNLPIALPSRIITATHKDELLTFKSRVRHSLVAKGANELLTYSFVPGKLLENAGQDLAQAFRLSNALSPELQYYRLSLMPSLLEKVHPNSKAGYDQFALFEIGKGHDLHHATDDSGLPTEFEMLDLVVTAIDKVKPEGAAFYQARTYLDALATDLGLSLVYRKLDQPSSFPVAQPYDQSRSAIVSDAASGISLGMIGEFTTKTRQAFKLPVFSAGFSISPVHLMQAAQQAANSYRSLSRFPKVTQDITLRTSIAVEYQQLYDTMQTQLLAARSDSTTTSVELIGIYQKPDDTEHKQLTLRVTVTNADRTLTDKEVSKMLDAVALAVQDQFAAERT